jgi:hypothetical protein
MDIGYVMIDDFDDDFGDDDAAVGGAGHPVCRWLEAPHMVHSLSASLLQAVRSSLPTIFEIR